MHESLMRIVAQKGLLYYVKYLFYEIPSQSYILAYCYYHYCTDTASSLTDCKTKASLCLRNLPIITELAHLSACLRYCQSASRACREITCPREFPLSLIMQLFLCNLILSRTSLPPARPSRYRSTENTSSG